MYLPTIQVSPPLRCKQQPDGVWRLQGVFSWKDREGFPLDTAHDLAREQGWVVDWVEAFVDAARQGVDKYSDTLTEAMLIDPAAASDANHIFQFGMLDAIGDGFSERAEKLYQKMWA